MSHGLVRWGRRTALAVAVSLCAGCATGVPPLWSTDPEPVAGLRVTRVAGPFFERFERDDGSRGWVLRPLVARVHEGERTTTEWLYPLGAWTRTPSATRLRVTPLAEWTRTKRPPEAVAGTPPPEPVDVSSWTFGPAFGGRTAGGERYGGLFPLGGVAHDRFGVERAEFWLFPLFARTRHRDGFRRTYLLWPFFSWGSGGGRSLFRIWPFYGRDVKEGVFERHFALWPLVHWRHENPGAPAERRVRLVLPFWGESRSRHARAVSWGGPLYIRHENELTGARSLDLLWPFVRIAERPAGEGYAGSRELRFEPLFRWRREPGLERTAFALGAVERTHLDDPERRLARWRLLWVSRLDDEQRADGSTLRRREVWPFVRAFAERDAAGVERGRTAAPWWLPVHGEGWERHWLGLFTLYDHRWRGGESRTDALWGLWRTRHAD